MAYRPLCVGIGLFLLLTVACQCAASTVIAVQKSANTIHVSKDKKRPWVVGDGLCVLRKGNEIACGEITRVAKKFAVASVESTEDNVSKKAVQAADDSTYVELVFDTSVVKVGDSVARDDDESENTLAESSSPPPGKESGPARIPSSLSEDWSAHVSIFGDNGRDPASEEEFGKEDLYMEGQAGKHDPDEPWPLSNLTAGLNYIFPNVQYQQALSDHFATGLTGMYIGTPVGNGSLSGYGGYLNLSYYSQSAFKGSMVELAAGVFAATSHVNGNDNSFFTPSVMALAGWRWLMDSGLNFGFAVGAQYLVTESSSAPELGFSGLLPCIALDIGFGF